MTTLVPVTYGSFNLNDGINYFTISKNIPFPSINPSTFKIGRLVGMKKTGENINERKMSLQVRVVGSSRADLESKMDALQGAMWKRGQYLTPYLQDNRFFICDCTDVKYSYGASQVISVVVQLDFTAYSPYAYSYNTLTYDTGFQVMPRVGALLGLKVFTATFNIPGGGNVENAPVITYTNKTPAFVQNLGTALVKNTPYTSITLSAATTLQLYQGDNLILKTGSTTQPLVVANDTAPGATTITVGSFIANAAFPNSGGSATTVTRDTNQGGTYLYQNTDQIAVVGFAPYPVNFNDYLTFNCDPLQAMGYTVTLNGSTTVLNTISGSFPVLQPGGTSLSINQYCNSVPQFDMVVTYTPRWL